MILRHDIMDSKIANDSTIEFLFQRLSNAYKRIPLGKKVNLFNLKNAPLSIAITSKVKNIKDNVFWGINCYLQVGIAHFQRVLTTENAISINIGKEKFTINKENRKHGTDMYTWFELFNAALLLRDSTRQQQLIDLKVLEWNKDGDPFWIKMGRYMISLIGKDEKAKLTCLQNLREESKSDMGLYYGLDGNKVINIEGRSKKLQRLWMPVAELYELALRKEITLFNQQLEIYLQDKKAYIIENEKEDDPRFWINFPLLACCAYAHDLGIKITVKSEYIPDWVYRGEFEVL